MAAFECDWRHQNIVMLMEIASRGSSHRLKPESRGAEGKGADVGLGLVPRLGRPAVREMQALCWSAGVRRRRVSLVGGK